MAQYIQFNGGDALERPAPQLPEGLPGAGNILIFNNGIGRNYSSIEEITPPVDASGEYTLASGAAYGVRLLERARELGVQTHLVATPAGILNVHHELGMDRASLEALSTQAHAPGDVGACIASGTR